MVNNVIDGTDFFLKQNLNQGFVGLNVKVMFYESLTRKKVNKSTNFRDFALICNFVIYKVEYRLFEFQLTILIQ